MNNEETKFYIFMFTNGYAYRLQTPEVQYYVHITVHSTLYTVCEYMYCNPHRANVHITYDSIAIAYATMYMYMYIYVAVPRQDSMSACGTHAVLSGHCNRYVGYL